MRKTERQGSSLCLSPRTPYHHPRLSSLRSHSKRMHNHRNSSTIETTIQWPESAREPAQQTNGFNMSSIVDHMPTRLPKRTRIFNKLPAQYEHFTIGATMSNLQFEDLDEGLTTLCLSNSLCGCQDSTKCCDRIISFTNISKTRQMKKKYSTVKELRQDIHPSLVRMKMQDVPYGYPQILLPHVENLLRLIPMRESFDFKLLLTVVWHARVQYLSFWIYNDLKQSNNNQENFMAQLVQMIADYSRDLSSFLESTGYDIARFAHIFYTTCGTSIIPTSQFAKYLQNLNDEGRNYPRRVLFCVLLYCKKRLCSGTLDLDSMLHRAELANQLPWDKIFAAARNVKLK